MGEFVYFGESGGDDEHERDLAGGGGERDADLALWGQHVIEMGQTYLGLDAGWSDRIDIWAM